MIDMTPPEQKIFKWRFFDEACKLDNKLAFPKDYMTINKSTLLASGSTSKCC